MAHLDQERWQESLRQAKRSGSSRQLIRLLAHEKPRSNNIEQLREALLFVKTFKDYELLKVLLSHTRDTFLRVEALGLVIELIDERHPLFTALMLSLREGERAFVLGMLLEATKLEHDPEHRLLRLKHLLEAMPVEGRSLYWFEAKTLAEKGGDDAQLLLLGLARQLPEEAKPEMLMSLKESVKKVDNVFKRAMAYVTLAELGNLTLQELEDARLSATHIPDDALRAITLARLTAL